MRAWMPACDLWPRTKRNSVLLLMVLTTTQDENIGHKPEWPTTDYTHCDPRSPLTPTPTAAIYTRTRQCP
jgi:hypothetical protein